MKKFVSGAQELWKNARFKIVLWAACTGLAVGVTGIALPAEDSLRNWRWASRDELPQDSIVMVQMDQQSLEALDAVDVTRANDEDLINTLFAAGANRVFFNRTFTIAGAEADNAKFINALKKHPGRVTLGASIGEGGPAGNYTRRIPLPEYRNYAQVASILVRHRPLNLNVQLPYASDSPIGKIPSMSAAIAGVTGGTGDLYFPDFAISVQSIPSISYGSILNGNFDRNIVRGKDILVTPSAPTLNDLHAIPGQRVSAAGGYFHAIGAATLMRGIPKEYGWFPLFAVVLVLVGTGLSRGRVLDAYRFSGLFAALGAAPFLLDHVGIHVEVVPAFFVALVAVIRMRNLDRVEEAGETNSGSGLPSVQALRNSADISSRILVALKIRNYGAIIGSFSEDVEAQLAKEIVRRIRISDENVIIYHEGGMFIWLSSIRDTFDLFENLEGLHRIVQNGIQVGGIDVDLSFNCGVDADLDRSLSSRVASAMQAAEEAVRCDELVYQHDSRKNETQWEISLLTSLDRAIDTGEVWVAYQPKIDLRSNRICGAEALVRWAHPERGPISPEKFIRIAEEFHRIERITRFVLNDAVRTAVELERHGFELTMSINISAQLLRSSSLPAMISEVLTHHGLSPNRLILEITETDRLDRSSRTYQMLQRLVQSGLRLSIDDFGTGNATIDYLRYLPASEVKIDKSFVLSLDENNKDLLLVQSIIEMAHSLDRTVVAEGVETAQVLDMLKGMGCDLVQGYYISRPVPFPEFLEFVSTRRARLIG